MKMKKINHEGLKGKTQRTPSTKIIFISCPSCELCVLRGKKIDR